MPTRASLLTLSLLVVACQPAQSARPSRSAGSAEPRASTSAATEACKSELVTGQPVRGVIFAEACGPAFADELRYAADEAVIGYFQPTPALIQTLELRLRPALELGLKKPESVTRMPTTAEDRAEVSWGLSSAIAEILEHFAEYRRQYVGIVVRGGARRVLVNCFPEVDADGKDEFPDWTERWIDDVDDGGELFWRIQYDAASGRFLGFDINASG